MGLLIHGSLGLAPKGQQDSAQGFNPGNPQNKWFALKGREMRLRDESRTYYGAKVRVPIESVRIGHWTPYFHLVRTFALAPLQGACSLDIYRNSRFVGRAKLRLSRDRMRGEINHRFHRFHRLRSSKFFRRAEWGIRN